MVGCSPLILEIQEQITHASSTCQLSHPTLSTRLSSPPHHRHSTTLIIPNIGPFWQGSGGSGSRPYSPVGRPRADRGLLFTGAVFLSPPFLSHRHRRSRRSSFFRLRGSGSPWHLSPRGRPTGAGAGATGALPKGPVDAGGG